MKQILTFAFMLCCCLSHAQQHMRLKTELVYHYGGIDEQKFELTDTFGYFYNSQQSYSPVFKKWQYDCKLGYGSQFPYDSIEVFKIDTCTYDNNDNLIYETFSNRLSGGMAIYKVVSNTYDANNLPVTGYTKELDNGNWITTSEYKYTYDGQKSMIEEVTGKYSFQFETFSRDSSIYTYASNLKSTALDFDWDVVGNKPLITQYRFGYKNSIPDTTWRDYYDLSTATTMLYRMQTRHYNSNNDLDTTSFYYWDSFSQTWFNINRDVFIYDNNHNQLNHIYQRGSDWHNTYMDSVVYNTANLPMIVFEELKWDKDSSKFVFDESFLSPGTIKTNYYYEFPTSVSEVEVPSHTLHVYPNPASKGLNIQFQNKSDDVLSFTISDMMGKAVKHWNEAPTKLYQKCIDVSDLPDGQYMIKTSGDIRAFQHFSVIH